MKRLKNSMVSLCLMLILSIMAPVQVQPVNTPTPVSIQKVVQVDAKTKKKAKKKKSTKKKSKKKTTRSVTVYITKTGKCYHARTCSRGTYYKSTLKSAKASRLRPCKKCY